MRDQSARGSGHQQMYNHQQLPTRQTQHIPPPLPVPNYQHKHMQHSPAATTARTKAEALESGAAEHSGQLDTAQATPRLIASRRAANAKSKRGRLKA